MSAFRSDEPACAAGVARNAAFTVVTSRYARCMSTPREVVMDEINIGLDMSQRSASIAILNRVLATETILMIKTKKFHWDVGGPQFVALHAFWDAQHGEMATYVERIAERTRSLGGLPLGTAAAFIEYSAIKERPGDIPSASVALQRLIEDHETFVRTLREDVAQCEGQIRDRGTEDLLATLLAAHEKMAATLRSFLEGERVVGDGRAVHGRVPRLG